VKNCDGGLKSLVVKILTSKLFDIKILQILFADPVPVKAFGGWGRGGILETQIFRGMKTASRAALGGKSHAIFSANFHRRKSAQQELGLSLAVLLACATAQVQAPVVY
jgi:hypothetical protein